MIELNLTYEESKKIFELGYDFSKICQAWQAENTSLYYGSIDDQIPNALIREVVIEGVVVDGECEEIKIDAIGLHSSWIPIIPKAALEACLPDINYLEWLGHALCDLDPGEYSPKLITLAKRFTCAYEAFIWCHENYLEELKKKFEEVMK